MDDYDAYDAILHHLFKTTQGDAWFKPSQENISAGVCLRTDTGKFRVFPYENRYLQPFELAVRSLNPVVAIKCRSAAVHAALATVADDASAIYLDVDTRIQVVDTMGLLPRADKEQCGAFIRDERVLVIWSFDLDHILPLFHDFEDKLIKLVWRARATISAPPSTIPSAAASTPASNAASDLNLNEKVVPVTVTATDTAALAALAEKEKVKPLPSNKFLKAFSWKVGQDDVNVDLEKAGTRSSRPIRLLAPFYNGLGAGLSIYFILSGASILLRESVLDGDWTRFALLVCSPMLVAVSLFFAIQLVGNLAFVFGPVAQYHENSKYYSARKPKANPEVDQNLPHFTIQVPVYKESLDQVIAPSVFSLKKAMQTYARQGGTSTIFINDDGLQLLDEKEREERIAFYANHNIGWVARPKHSNEPDGFKRAGRFKKASNMNYGLALSLLMEKHLKALQEAGEQDGEQTLEERALEMAIEETTNESGFRPWAANAKSCRVGAIILICDSDTLVPEDCLRDAARELHESPEVAIIQHCSDVMQVQHDFFENGISHFTRRINKCISMGCANGEVAPFVGHNAFLRWSAVQDAAFVDEADGKLKMWSESNVSEDFDIALRLQLKGYIIRWATYSEGGFKEGVSLTVDDELNRWQKYAYGCSELLFEPLVRWWYRGPITKQIRIFVWSDAPLHYKLSMMAYMFSYYGIAAAAALSVMNYLILGFALEIDGYFLKSFEVWLACTVVFPGLGNLGYTLLEYRLGHRSILSSLAENLTWVPFFFFFFGGLSIHLTTALLSHLFSYNITWGATKKEVERSNFFIEIPKIIKRFWFCLLLCVATGAAMAIFSTPLVTDSWQITGSDWAVIFPLAIVVGCHFLFPIVLNPWLMVFSY